ncbi:hypothetical protein TRFO_07554 [Tritrichomonas foetus]|uniref:Uncharacterized protein n=1 Tax=Tritrichomonas foetus TaxID=1144522 RepID=A0A1J4JQL4_9EUKA|nr:hypothetical protein TRFO_07554 [Tritrichomonas foetus]|eukprot:OHT01331.1 hypothetical protein TRFO_07554 [Tritrichomonas foetus]
MKTKCQNDIEELNVRFEELTNTNEELKQKSEELATKDDNILHILTEPYDPLTNEAAYVEKIEHEIEEWSKRLEQFPLSETSNDVKKAIDVLYTIQQDNDKRKEVLHKRKDDIVATNLKMTAASRALTSSTRYKTTMTGMRGGVMLNHQHKLAINMVKDIFLKISQKEQFIADENQMVDEMIEEHQKKIDPIMKEWNDKMLKVEELTKNLSEIDAVVIDIARVTNETDELKREETQLKYEIEKNQRVISNIEDDKKNIERKQKENQSIKERIEMKRKQIEEYGKELQEKREVIEADRAKYDVGYAEYLEEEKKIEEIKKLQGELSKKLESTVANGNALIGSLGITEDEYDYSQDPSFTQDPSNTPSQKQTKQGYTIQPMSPLEVSQIEGKDPGKYSILENSQTNDTLQDSTLNESTLDESQLNESQIALSQLEESPIKKPSPENQNQEKESIEQVNHEPINQNNEEDTPVVATE